jgi:multiple antibiotic resistance protein
MVALQGLKIKGEDFLLQAFINEFILLFVAIDPIGTVPLLAALTRTMDEPARRRLVTRGVTIAACVLFSFAIFGQILLTALGVSFASFRIAGGVLLFLVGVQMVFQAHAADDKHNTGEFSGRDLAIFPIALPYIAGPGAILAVMVVMRGAPDVSNFMLKCVTLAAVMGTTLWLLLSTSKLNKLLGRTGSEVIARVMGILLAALAAESVVRGILEALGRSPL